MTTVDDTSSTVFHKQQSFDNGRKARRPQEMMNEEYKAPLVPEVMRQRPSQSRIQSKPCSKRSPQQRFVDRDGVRQKSRGTWNLKRIRTPGTWRLYLNDPFHTLVNFSLYKVLILLTIVYIVTAMVFAFLYMAVDASCKAETVTFHQGFLFSVITLFTIGYGAGGNDIYFNSCAFPVAIITVESLIGVFLDAIAFGVIYQRFARAQTRANTVSLTKYACVQKLRGHLYFMFQICEMRKHQLIEAHVRCYAILNKTHNSTQFHLFQSHPMRLQHPDDDIGGMLLLALPSIVVHRLDAWSPLLSPVINHYLDEQAIQHNPAAAYQFPEPVQRIADEECGNREDRHNVKPQYSRSSTVFEARDSTNGGAGVGNSNSFTEKSVSLVRKDEIDAFLRYWKDCQLEIIVLVEGIDAPTSSTVQVRHSYKACDILFNHGFENCVLYDEESSKPVIDFNLFHAMKPLDFEAIKISER